MRSQFSNLRVAERHADGELTVRVTDSRPAPRRARQGRGARSQMVEYLDRGRLVAICHRYLKADGSLGASGQPDPKWLWVDGDIWYSGHSDSATCDDCAAYRPSAAQSPLAPPSA